MYFNLEICFSIKTWQNTHAGYRLVRFGTNKQATLCYTCLQGFKVSGNDIFISQCLYKQGIIIINYIYYCFVLKIIINILMKKFVCCNIELYRII